MENPGNFIAPLALLAWIPFTLLLFMRLNPTVAGTISIVGGSMFLPEHAQFLLPIFPDIDKTVISIVATFLGCLLRARHKLAENKSMAMDLCLAVMIVGDIGNWQTNTDTLFGQNAPFPRMGLTYYEALGDIATDIVVPFGMFWLGRTLIARGRDVLSMLRTCFGLALVYTIFCLVELRFSPQMNVWVYGYHQHDFIQTIRGGGYRPMVFMAHGLVVARFMAVAALSGLLLWRLNSLKRPRGWALLYLTVVFVLCKSTGAIVLFVLFAPMIAFAKSTGQARLAAIIALIVGFYPLLRGLDVVPIDDALELARNVSEDRANSLQTRFDNEDRLLERGRERPWFGWGGNSRHQTYDQWGQSEIVVDGEWTSVLATRGLVGFIGYYGLYVLPLLYAHRRLRAMSTNDYMLLLGGFMLITAMLTLETLPNAPLTLPQMFWSGALVGAARGITREDQARRAKQRELRRRPAAAPPIAAQPESEPAAGRDPAPA